MELDKLLLKFIYKCKRLKAVKALHALLGLLNKPPQIGGLKQVYHLIVLEAKIPKSRCYQVNASSETCSENSSLSS